MRKAPTTYQSCFVVDANVLSKREYEPYYDDIHLAIDYADDGRVLKEYLEKEKGQKHWSRRISSSDRYGQIGLTYPERTTSDFSPRPLPSGTIFSATGHIGRLMSIWKQAQLEDE